MNKMTITRIYPTMSFNPVSNSTVQLGDEVHITSDLQSIVHTIAERYGMHDDHGGPCEQNAIFYSTTNDWDDEVQQELEGSVTITELGTTTVESSAAIGQIIVDGEAVYNVVPVSHSIEAMWLPQDAGSVSVVSAANEGQTVTFSVQANAGYSLSSLTVSQDSNAQPIDYTDNGVNWTIVHFDGDAEYYLYNIAEEKFLDMTDTPTFTDMPVGLTIGVSGDKFYFSKNGKYLAVNPSTGAPVTTTTSLSNASYFNLIDNITMQPALSVSGKARDAVEAFKNFATNVENLGKILDIPEGCVGYISDPTRRQQITELYNDGNVSTSKMEEVLNAIKSEEGRITFSPDEKVYRLHSCYADRAAAPIAQLRENLGFKTEAKSENPAQMWVLKGKNEYYMMNIQGKAFAAIDDMSGKQPKVTDKDAAVATAVHDMGGYRFAIASSPTATYGFGAMSPSSCRTALVSGESGQWWLEEVNDLEITTNASGLAPLYYDFDVVLPEGLKAYTVRGVDANGVIDAVEIAAEVIPAGTPLILLGAPATAYTLTVKAYGNGEVSAQNLVGNYMENTGMTANEYYVLGADGTTPVMNLSTVTTLGANQVYLPKAADMGDLTKLTFKFSEPTGIDAINADESDMLSPRYNLKGQRVGKDAKGVIIQNGKKTINR